LSGLLLADPPIDFHFTASHLMIAHFHYVLFDTIVFASFAGVRPVFLVSDDDGPTVR
jgi:cytochrome c oxidase subunit 1